MSKNLTCIICPRGCALKVVQNGKELTVTGNSCPKGRQYAVAECQNPTRTVTSVVRVANRPHTMVSVKTQKPISKADIFDAMKIIRAKSVQAPVQIGDVIIKNVCGTDIVATKSIL